MQNPLHIGLSSWILADGNYEDFERGDKVAFALEFYAPAGLSVVKPESGETISLENTYTNYYRITGKVVHLREDWWVIDAGVLMYRKERPPRNAEHGCQVSGEIYLGIDPFFYRDDLSRNYDSPGLIYDWEIMGIRVLTAPLIERSPGVVVGHPKDSGVGIADTRDRRGEFVLHCKRLDGPPQR